MIEVDIIKLLGQQNQYTTYYHLIDTARIKDIYPELVHIYKFIKALHDGNPGSDYTVDELSALFFARYPDAERVKYGELFSQAKGAEISEAVWDQCLRDMANRATLLRVSEEAYKAAQGRSSVQDVTALLETVVASDASVTAVDDGFDMELTNLLDKAVRVPGLRWRLDFLNKSLGSLRGGDFGFLLKRPETGGTTFLASELTFMVNQTDRPLVWINNEEQNEKVAIRLYMAYFGVTLKELNANASKYKARWEQEIGGKIKFFGREYSTKAGVEGVYKTHKPALVVIDQIDKIQGFEASREDLMLGAIYNYVRDLSCTHSAASIGVTQADGTADGQKFLTMKHVANSKTAKQAEADFILGIGKTYDPNDEAIRYLSISKNKLHGDEDSIEEMRHGRGSVLIKPSIMRYEDIITNY